VASTAGPAARRRRSHGRRLGWLGCGGGDGSRGPGTPEWSWWQAVAILAFLPLMFLAMVALMLPTAMLLSALGLVT
jgi:hypothetical protein